MNEKLKVASLSVLSGAILTIIKLIVGMKMNSASVIAEGVHSGLDLMAAVIAFMSVRESVKPADERHRYGHGKFENLAGIIEAFLIVGASLVILFTAVPRLTAGLEVHLLDLGVAVMGGSSAINFFVSRRLMQVARRTASPALAADAWHLRTDVYTSLGVFAGIIGIKLTGLVILDPLIAIGLSLFILKVAFGLIRDSLRSILDVRLSDSEEKIIKDVMAQYADEFIEFHELRTRRAGPQRYIDLHLVVPKNRAVIIAHALCDRIEESIRNRLPEVQILIHTEPCGQDCPGCSQINISVCKSACRCNKN